MYHYNLVITLCSNDPLLETETRKIAPLERFEHSVVVCRKWTPSALADADILILDLPALPALADIRALCRQDALVVLCADQQQRVALQSTDWQFLDALWLKPFDAAYIAFNLRQLFLGIKVIKDRNLYLTYLDTAIDSIPDLVWFKDLRGAHLKVNTGFCQAVGKPKEVVEGRGHYFIWDLKKEEYEKGEYVCLETEDVVIAERKTCLFDEKVKSKNGMRQFKTHKSPLFDDRGKLMGTVGIAHDVTDLQNMDAELEIILRSLPFAIIVTDNDNTIIKTNETFDDAFQTRGKDLIGAKYDVWKHTMFNTLSVENKEGYAEATICFDGVTKIMEVHEETIFDVFHNQVGQLCFYRDVTIERTFEQQILHNANTDVLTGLYNRRFFYTFMEANRTAKQVSLLYLDIDNFKKINDTYGHQIGDQALITVATAIRETFPDDLTARVGGDEFLIAILGDCEVQVLEHHAGLLLQRLQERFQASHSFQVLSASIGIACTRNPEMDIDELIKEADMALYAAKRGGKSQYWLYTSDLSENRS